MKSLALTFALALAALGGVGCQGPAGVDIVISTDGSLSSSLVKAFRFSISSADGSLHIDKTLPTPSAGSDGWKFVFLVAPETANATLFVTVTALDAVEGASVVGCGTATAELVQRKSTATIRLTASSTCAQAGTCLDGILNQDESDLDCGGACDGCANQQACRDSTDCLSTNCGLSGGANVCLPPDHCDNTVQDGNESDINCGGVCNSCSNGKHCSGNRDCSSQLCSGGVCVAPAECMDNLKNGGESDLDCGGSACDACALDKDCVENRDCASQFCAQSTHKCVPAVKLTLVLLGSGNGSVSSSGGEIAASAGGAPRETYFATGSTVTLTAVPNLASGDQSPRRVHFSGCTPGGTLAAPNCTLTMDSAHTVTVTLDNNNYMFVTKDAWSVVGASSSTVMGGIAGADAKCQAAATAAQLPNAASYKAWLSSSASVAHAAVRIGGSLSTSPRGWTRTDGRAFADQIAVGARPWIYYPPIVAEDGIALGADNAAHIIDATHPSLVVTGTNNLGQAAATCADGTSGVDWMDADGSLDFGYATSGVGNWTQFSGDQRSCGARKTRIYCFETTETRALVAPSAPASELIVFLSEDWHPFAGRSHATADAQCALEASNASLSDAGHFVSLLASTGTSAVSYLGSAQGPWYRADGVEVARTLADLQTGNLLAPINISADGAIAYPAENANTADTWTGAGDAQTAGTSTCSGWSTTSGTTTMGRSYFATPEYFARTSELGSASCAIPSAHLYCAQGK